jgi:anionic cell wall polymer biosynthesis LytR-Cps2A-Psr (LCP) family protein
VIEGVQSLAVRALTARYDRSLVRRSLLDPSARRPNPSLAGPLNFLLIGSTHPATAETGPRVDVVMVGHVAADFDRAHLVSVPHNLRLDVPPYAATGHPGGTDLVGAALAGGDPPDAAQHLSVALARLMDIRFDGAAIIDLDAMPSVIDRVGGVQVLVPTPRGPAQTGAVSSPGERRMAGEEALDYAGRHPAPDGDRDHHRRHQQLWRATAARLADLDLLTNPLRLDQMVRDIGSAMVIDTNGLSLDELADAIRNLRSTEVSGVEVPVQPSADGPPTHTLPGAEASALFGSLRAGDLDAWARENPRWVIRL